MTTKKARLGLITTGQEPRNEYVRYHRNLMWEFGVDAKIRIRNAQDRLTREQFVKLSQSPATDTSALMFTNRARRVIAWGRGGLWYGPIPSP